MHDVINRDSRIFEYSLYDSWEGRIATVILFQNSQRVAYYFADDDSLGYYPSHRSFPTVEISKETIEKVKKILARNRIYQIEKLAEPRLFMQRGFHHEFYFSDGKRENRLRSEGQVLFERDNAEYENNRYIVRLLKQIADILVPEGIDPRCFQLTYKKVYLPLAG